MEINMEGLFKKGVRYPLKKYAKFQEHLEPRLWANRFGTTQKYLITSFAFYIMLVLKKRVALSVETQTIDGQQMKSVYQRLSPNYKKKNPKNIGKFYYDTEFLIRSLRVWLGRSGEVRFGIPKHILHDNGTPAYKIYQYLEFGTRGKDGKQIIPARSLIHPHLTFIFKNIDRYWAYFLDLVLKGTIKLKGTPSIKGKDGKRIIADDKAVNAAMTDKGANRVVVKPKVSVES